MKTLIVLLVVLSASLAFGQVVAGGSVLNSQPQMLQVPSFPRHAAIQALGREQSLLEPSTMTSAKGERPLWEFASPEDTIPLGDVARMLRAEHATVKKAEKVWTN